MSVNSQPAPVSLLRSLTAHTNYYQSQQQQQQQQRLLEMTAAASSPPRGPHSTTVRQMSCPEPTAAADQPHSAHQRSEHRPMSGSQLSLEDLLPNTSREMQQFDKIRLPFPQLARSDILSSYIMAVFIYSVGSV